jgi:Xaa-Pro dipeptidase
MPDFERSEFLARLARTRRRMAERGIDLLVLTDPCNLYYLSGYDAWSFYVPQALLVPLDEQEPVWVGRGMDVAAARQTAFMGPDNLVGYPDRFVQSPDRHPMHFVGRLIEERGWAHGVIGVELGAYYYSALAHRELTGALPKARFVDASLLVNWVRVVKSAAEIKYLEEASRIVERAMTAGIAAIAVGVRQCDVAGAIYQAQMRGTEEYGGQYTSSPPLIPSGPRASAPHLSWTDEPYRAGEPTTLELVAARHRYHAPIGRTVFLGRPPAKVSAVADAVVEGLSAALDAVRPGVVAEEIEAVWRRTVARHGVEKESRIGYSIGIAYPPTWGEQTISLRPNDRTVLEPNMTLHLIPGIWVDEWGMVITEAFRVTETGCQTLCSYPRQLVVKP